jgi:alanyl-tRNA synthetase
MENHLKSSEQIRREFLEFFQERGHTVVPSASLVPVGDPTLLFTNAGMNQFKDVFLGTGNRAYRRACDTQKCLRVSGKHNDLDEVGHDTYHHTLFEMLGNWSFGDYFKREAIRWAWELLVEQWKLPPERLYATVHEGDSAKGLDADQEAANYWRTETTLDPHNILFFGSDDNFWMMGDTGPCGPCSEVHIDLRSDEERAALPGSQLVNTGNPLVIEIWNLVFIQYNALANGLLEPLASKHIDTGMGFERVTAVLQGKTSNYDTDLFAPILQKTADLCPLEYVRGYEQIELSDQREIDDLRIAMRVIADHIRTIAFAIADHATPGNVGRGYVIRRILRRAVYYGYQYLQFRQPFLYQLLDALCQKMAVQFPELERYRRSIERITEAEELSFLRTIEAGKRHFDRLVPHVKNIHCHNPAQDQTWSEVLCEDSQLLDLLAKSYRERAKDEYISDFIKTAQRGCMPGEVAFLLHDTYGFPFDLTQVMCREQGLNVDIAQYEAMMEQQKNRARLASNIATGHAQSDTWTWLADKADTVFVGYDTPHRDGLHILAYRTIEGEGGQSSHQLILDCTPFYAESGGQIGDTGILQIGEQSIAVLDTFKEDGYHVHIVAQLPTKLDAPVLAHVDIQRRQRIARHHSATHLLHAALREILGPHVQQQGSLVAPDRLRFDFTHFERITPEQLRDIEALVNAQIMRNIPRHTETQVPVEEALQRGAIALFGEKYGETVRIVSFDPDYSVELCGGIHVQASGEIGLFHLISESAIASGIRRVEAVTGSDAIEIFQRDNTSLNHIRQRLHISANQNIEDEVFRLYEQARQLEKDLAQLRQTQLIHQVNALLANPVQIGPVQLIRGRIDGIDSGVLRQLIQDLRDRLPPKTIAILGSSVPDEGKAYLGVAVADDLIKQYKLKAGDLVANLAKIIGGGGGGKPTIATAGGREYQKLDLALQQAQELIANAISS